jgi:hypothetical protein
MTQHQPCRSDVSMNKQFMCICSLHELMPGMLKGLQQLARPPLLLGRSWSPPKLYVSGRRQRLLQCLLRSAHSPSRQAAKRQAVRLQQLQHYSRLLLMHMLHAAVSAGHTILRCTVYPLKANCCCCCGCVIPACPALSSWPCSCLCTARCPGCLQQ